MKTKEDILQFLHNHREYLSEHFSVREIALFGSFARDEQHENSDVDLLIELDEKAVNIYDLKTSLKEYLSHAFQRNVDIARIKYLKPYAKEAILKDAMHV